MKLRPPRQILVVLLSALLTVSLAGLRPAAATSSPGVVPLIVPSTLSAWGSCSDPSLASYGLECARLTVPLDYADTSKGTISLAVSRLAHDPNAGGYLGMLVGNPGGPGGSGTWLPALADYVPHGVGHRYDWIGFDPRGVGASSPALRCNSKFFGVNRPNYVPRTHRLMRFWLIKTTRYANQCGRAAAKKLLPYLTTKDTVRDMESLRAAYQAQNPSAGPKLNFYGFSYGTYLGQVYATMFPGNVGRFVLDGVVDPTKVWYRANLDQDRAFDLNMNVYFQWLARHNHAFKLGTHWRQIRRGYYRMLKKLDRHPAAGGRLGPDELNDAMVSAGYYVYGWNEVGNAYSKLVRKGKGGAIFKMYADANMGDDNSYAMYNAVQCTDAKWPRWAKQRRDTWRMNRYHPFLAWNNTWYNAPCRTWPAPKRTPVHVNGQALGAKILLVSETRDAATPYTGALRTRKLFPSASLIAGKNGTTHAGSLSGVACVDNAIATYLATGVPPTRRGAYGADLICPKVPPPGAQSSARVSGLTGLPPTLRQQLMQAQQSGH